MRRPSSLLAPGRRHGPSAGPHLVPLAGEWALWHDVAVRTAGFPVSGLNIFGAQDERAGLRAVARDPLFQTAVTGQNRAVMARSARPRLRRAVDPGADPAGLTARARPEARPETRAANLRS
jgi:hypothetical protein